jgi:hypothetical protein
VKQSCFPTLTLRLQILPAQLTVAGRSLKEPMSDRKADDRRFR